MIPEIFENLTGMPLFKRLLWRPIYNFLARKIPQPDWQVMNYGDTPAPQIERYVPTYFQRYFKHFSGAEGTINYTQFQKGKRYYFRYVLQKA